MEEWFADGAADGFNILPPWFPGAFDDFVDASYRCSSDEAYSAWIQWSYASAITLGCRGRPSQSTFKQR